MATEATTATATPTGPAAESGEGGRGRGNRGRGRGQGRGRGRGRGVNNGEGFEGRPAGGNQRAGRGGRGGGAAHGSSSREGNTNTGLIAGESDAASPRKIGPRIEKISPEGGDGKDDVEAEVCFICASDVEHMSVAPCNHRTCHICALRMRALYKTNDCAHCRTTAESVIFTDNPTKNYEDFTAADIASADLSIGIKYENNEIREDTLLLLRYNCPDPSCDVACLGWPDLHRHVRAIHHKKICDLCSRHKKVFTHEHELFTDKELEKHMRRGDDNPGALDQSGFKGHPLCGFCGQRFYGDDELFIHCREKHEKCFICDRTSPNPTYYVNLDSLIQHYQKEHYPCLEPECVAQKLIVFGSQMDLKAHQLEKHKHSLSKDVRRDARMVDISDFDYRSPYVPERRGGPSRDNQRDGRGRGRGRDPNAEPIPASTAQPLRRDEQAFQRQMAIHSAQSVAPRTFGGQLTAGPTPAQSRALPSRQNAPQPSSSATDTNRNSTTEQPPANLSPEEQARQLRHRHVIDRATTLLRNDQIKLDQFRSFISSYKNNSMTAANLIEAFFGLFVDTASDSLGTLVREVADLYENQAKSDSLRTAWNDWKAINEDYPSLPGPASMASTSLPGMGWATVTNSAQPSVSAPTKAKSSRVLKLKSSTAQSSRSQVSQTASWGGPASTPASSSNGISTSQSSNLFPSLPSSRPNASSTKITTTPWVAPTSSAPPSARPTPPTSRPVSRGPAKNGPGTDMFPALPPAAKPQSTIFGYGRGMVRRDGLGGTGNSNSFSWGASGSGVASENEDASAQGEGETDGKKRKGKKKQVLMNWG